MKRYVIAGLFVIFTALVLVLGLSCGGAGTDSGGVPAGVTVTIPPGL